MSEKKHEFLYHFTKVETAIRFILPRNELRFNKVRNVNDPVENLLHFTRSNENIFPQKNMIDTIMADLISNNYQIISFSIDRNFNEKTVKPFQRQRSWTQYGDNNSGICFKINREKLIEENKICINEFAIDYDFVEYNDYSPKYIPRPKLSRKPSENNEPIKLFDLPIKDKSTIKNRFFCKNSDWIDESEYRFLVYSKEEIFLSFKNSLDCVILGPNFSKYFLSSILQFIPKDKIFGIEIDDNGNFIKQKIS